MTFNSNLFISIFLLFFVDEYHQCHCYNNFIVQNIIVHVDSRKMYEFHQKHDKIKNCSFVVRQRQRIKQYQKCQQQIRFVVKRQQHQNRRQQIIKQKKIRLIKKQIDAKTKTKTFACRRCFVKYVNNIKLHQHIRDHHAKSKTFIAFVTSSFKSISITSSIKSFLFHFASISITFSFTFLTSSKIT